jgi:hypothetical protein
METTQFRYRRARLLMKKSRQPAAIAFIAASLIACGSTAFAQVGGAVVQGAGDGPLHAAACREGARLAQSSATSPQARQQNPGWIVRHPVMFGTLVGTAGGAALSRVEAVGGAKHDPRVALVGAASGAWGGLIASAVHKARSNAKVGAGTKIGIVAGAVGLIALPVLACYGAGGCGGSS